MIDLVSILIDFNSAINNFDFIYNILVCSLDSLNKFIGDNISRIEVHPNYISMKIIVLDSSVGDSENIKNFYFHEVKNVNNLLDKLGSNLDNMRDLDNLWSEKIQSKYSYDQCISDFYDRWHKYNEISGQCKQVITYKHAIRIT